MLEGKRILYEVRLRIKQDIFRRIRMFGYYEESELAELGLKGYGKNVLISRKVSIIPGGVLP